MIDLQNQTIILDDLGEDKIQRWEVWFVTASGMFKTLDEALADPKHHLGVVPIPVACGTRLYEPSISQGILIDGSNHDGISG